MYPVFSLCHDYKVGIGPSPHAGHNQPPACVYKYRLIGTQPNVFVYVLSTATFMEQRLSCIVATESRWPSKTKTFLSGLLRKKKKKRTMPDMVAHICNPSMWEAETGRLS